MVKNIVFAFLIFVCFSAIGDYRYINSIHFNRGPFFTTDKLGNVFVILGRQLLEFDKNGKPLANFSKSNYGDLQNVDASNPMKILLFYPDFAQLVILNNTLAEQATINLRASGIDQPLVACGSENGGFWIYDNGDDQLKKLDLNLQILYQSGSITQATGNKIQPQFIIEEQGFVYISDPQNGILVFDHFGTYYKSLPFKGLKEFQVVDKNILFIRDNKLFRYDTKTVSEQEILLPVHDSLINTRIEQQQLYLLTSDSLSFYSF